MTATETHERPPYVYGEILSRSIYPPQSSPLLPFGRFVSQGMAASSFMTFVVVLILVLADPGNRYNFVFIFLMPFMLAGAMVFGLIEGFIIWGCTRLAQSHLNLAARGGIGMVALGILDGVYWWLVPRRQYGGPTQTEILWTIGISLISGLVIGLVTGSELQPWRELVRGAKALPTQSRLLTGTTGLLLRVIVLFFVMDAIIATICAAQTNYRLQDAVTVFIMLGHFVAATVIVFARMKFWLLLPLALIVNLPSAYFLRQSIKHDDVVLSSVAIGYLALWTIFSLTRWQPTYTALAFFKEEFRYYLID